tara:strand:- start:204 stop:446 length:243 start_codon:yes stop_codon:yes gene_type:complete
MDVPGCESPNDGSTVWFLADKAVLYELKDGIVNGSATDAEFTGQGQFAQGFAGTPAPGEDVLEETLIGLVGQAGIPARYL